MFLRRLEIGASVSQGTRVQSEPSLRVHRETLRGNTRPSCSLPLSVLYRKSREDFGTRPSSGASGSLSCLHTTVYASRQPQLRSVVFFRATSCTVLSCMFLQGLGMNLGALASRGVGVYIEPSLRVRREALCGNSQPSCSLLFAMFTGNPERISERISEPFRHVLQGSQKETRSLNTCKQIGVRTHLDVTVRVCADVGVHIGV